MDKIILPVQHLNQKSLFSKNIPAMVKIHAMNNTLNLPSGKTKPEIEKAMEKHIIGSGELIGLYPPK
jgi:hypothetical protein